MKEKKSEKQRKSKENFLLYHNMYDLIDEVPDEIVGAVIKSVFRYSIFGEEPKFKKGTVKHVIFKAIKNSIDANTKKYYETCEKNKRNAEKRWRDNQNQVESEEENEEYIIINNDAITKEEFEKKYENADHDFYEILEAQKDLVRDDQIHRLIEVFHNQLVNEETIRKYIKV